MEAERIHELRKYHDAAWESLRQEIIKCDEEIEEIRRKDLSQSCVLRTPYERGCRYGFQKAMEIIDKYFDERYKELE